MSHKQAKKRSGLFLTPGKLREGGFHKALQLSKPASQGSAPRKELARPPQAPGPEPTVVYIFTTNHIHYPCLDTENTHSVPVTYL